MNFSKISIEKVRKFWDSRPCNIKRSSARIGTKKYFNEVEKRKYFVEPHIPRFAEFEKWKGKKVLEIGCGIGTDTINFARSGARVTAVDISGESLKIARKRAKVYGLSHRITFYQANAERLSDTVPVEPYDLIYSFGVIHHTPNPDKAIKELTRYCSRQTTIKIMVYHRWSWKVLWILLKYGKGIFWQLDQLIAKYSEAAIGSPVTYVYSKNEAKQLLKDFNIKEMFVDHIFPYSIPEYKKYQYKKVWYFRILPDSFFRKLEKKFGWHLCITAIPNKDLYRPGDLTSLS